MNTKRMALCAMLTGLFVLAVSVPLVSSAEMGGKVKENTMQQDTTQNTGDMEKMEKSDMHPMCPMCKMNMQTMADMQTLLADAKKAAEGGDAKTAATKIEEAQVVMEKQHKKMHAQMGMRMMKGMTCPVCGKMADDQTMGAMGAVVNVRCPVMGTKIDPENVPANLQTGFNGQKVGFCCGGCRAEWNKLSAKEKQEKLDAAMK